MKNEAREKATIYKSRPWKILQQLGFDPNEFEIVDLTYVGRKKVGKNGVDLWQYKKDLFVLVGGKYEQKYCGKVGCKIRYNGMDAIATIYIPMAKSRMNKEFRRSWVVAKAMRKWAHMYMEQTHFKKSFARYEHIRPTEKLSIPASASIQVVT